VTERSCSTSSSGSTAASSRSGWNIKGDGSQPAWRPPTVEQSRPVDNSTQWRAVHWQDIEPKHLQACMTEYGLSYSKLMMNHQDTYDGMCGLYESLRMDLIEERSSHRNRRGQIAENSHLERKIAGCEGQIRLWHDRHRECHLAVDTAWSALTDIQMGLSDAWAERDRELQEAQRKISEAQDLLLNMVHLMNGKASALREAEDVLMRVWEDNNIQIAEDHLYGRGLLEDDDDDDASATTADDTRDGGVRVNSGHVQGSEEAMTVCSVSDSESSEESQPEDGKNVEQQEQQSANVTHAEPLIVDLQQQESESVSVGKAPHRDVQSAPHDWLSAQQQVRNSAWIVIHYLKNDYNRVGTDQQVRGRQGGYK
jgi:hypothetical protein